MLEFLQAYGVWILLGGAFLFLMARGGGCGMSHTQVPADDQGQVRETGSRSSSARSRLDETAGRPAGAHSGGCH